MAQTSPANTAQNATNTVKAGTKSFGEFIKKFMHDWSHHTTQALAFVLVTSIIPLAMLIIAVVGKLIGSMSQEAQGKFLEQLQKMFPSVLGSQDIVRSAFERLSESAGIWIVVSMLAALFFGSRLFTLLEACFDIIYRAPIRSFKSKNLRAIALVVVFMVLTPLLVLASIIPGQLVALIQQAPFNSEANILNKAIGIISSLLVSFVLFEIIYTVIPNRQGTLANRARASVPGAIAAAMFLQIGLIIFPLLASISANGVVGQIAFALVFLLFFYVIAMVTLLGATVNAYYVENIAPAPTEFVNRVNHSR